jgi:hypothetical protein
MFFSLQGFFSGEALNISITTLDNELICKYILCRNLFKLYEPWPLGAPDVGIDGTRPVNQLLTKEQVADLLQVSVQTVYRNRCRLGGFYPAGLRVLRFREDDILACLERDQRMALSLPISGEEIQPGLVQDQGRGQGRRRGEKGRTQKGGEGADPNRHNLLRGSQ